GSRETPVFVDDTYCGTGYDAGGLVCDCAQNASVIALGKQREREQQHTYTHTEQVDSFSCSGHLQYGIHNTPLLQTRRITTRWMGPPLNLEKLPPTFGWRLTLHNDKVNKNFVTKMFP